MQSNKNLERQLENELFSNNQLTSTEKTSKLKQTNQIDHQVTSQNTTQINGKLKNGHSFQEQKSNGLPLKNGQNSPQVTAKGATPEQTDEVQNFDQIHQHFEGVHHQILPAAELTQAHMMTTNSKETANIVSGSAATREPDANGKGFIANTSLAAAKDSQQAVDAGTGYFQQDSTADLIHKCHSNDMNQVNRLLTSLGTQDKASKFLQERRNPKPAPAKEGRDTREIIQNELVDHLTVNRNNEEIAKARY